MFALLGGTEVFLSHELPGGSQGAVPAQALCHPLPGTHGEGSPRDVNETLWWLMKPRHPIITSVEVQSKSARLEAHCWISLQEHTFARCAAMSAAVRAVIAHLFTARVTDCHG